jgi:hypothetical protein
MCLPDSKTPTGHAPNDPEYLDEGVPDYLVGDVGSDDYYDYDEDEPSRDDDGPGLGD